MLSDASHVVEKILRLNFEPASTRGTVKNKSITTSPLFDRKPVMFAECLRIKSEMLYNYRGKYGQNYSYKIVG